MKAIKALAGVGLAAFLAGCQTATTDPGATILVDGDYATLAACYAKSQPNSVTDASVARTGFRTITITTSAPSAAGAELANSPDVGLATSYSVAFTEALKYRTQVTGARLGPAAVPFFWRETVIPQLRNCTGNPTLS